MSSKDGVGAAPAVQEKQRFPTGAAGALIVGGLRSLLLALLATLSVLAVGVLLSLALLQLLKELLKQLQQGQGQENANSQDGQGGQDGQDGQDGQQQGSQSSGSQGGQGGRALGRAGRAMGDASRSLGQGQPSDAYGHQGEALDALRQGLKGMMQQMYANGQGQPGRQAGGQNGSDRDPLGRPRRRQGPDLGQDVKVPDEVDVERARQILEAIRGRLGERSRPRYELDYLERLLRELD